MDDMNILQIVFDFLIALAYFSIPIEFTYFLHKSKIFPYKWLVALFGGFIVLCGASHVLTTWTLTSKSRASLIAMTAAKIATAFVSLLTAGAVSRVIPELLSVKQREQFLTAKTKQLDIEVGRMKEKEEAGRFVRILTTEIRSSLDRHTILNTTLVELARILHLENCVIWMPKQNEPALELSYSLKLQTTKDIPSVSLSDNTVQMIFKDAETIRIPVHSTIAMCSCVQNTTVEIDDIFAVRLPLLTTSSFHCALRPKSSTVFAVMVLVVSKQTGFKWGKREMAIVEAVVDQVVVALSHATVLEESFIAREDLMRQNVALENAKGKVEEAMKARNDFIAVMNHEMRTPMHAIVALSSLLLESVLDDDQKSMVEMILSSSNVLSDLIDDVLDFSRLENDSLCLNLRPFRLPDLIRGIQILLTPTAVSKDLQLIFSVPENLPGTVVGDTNRILHVLLNIVGNAIKFTERGHVDVDISTEPVRAATSDDDPSQSEEPSEIRTTKPGSYVNVHFVVRDTGIGIKPADLPKLFNKFVQADSGITRKFGGSGLGLAISKKFVELMKGGIQIESPGPGKGSTCSFFLQLEVVDDGWEGSAPNEITISGFDELDSCKTIIAHEINAFVHRPQQPHTPETPIYQTPTTTTPQISPSSTPDRRSLMLLIPTPADRSSEDHEFHNSIDSSKAQTVNDSDHSADHTPHALSMVSTPPKTPRLSAQLRRPSGLSSTGCSESFRKSSQNAASTHQTAECSTPHAATSSTALAPADSKTPPSLNGLRVLYVDDNHINRVVTKRLLENLGCIAVVVDSGENCLKLIEEQGIASFGVILLDLCMPEMDGFEVATEIVRRYADQRPPMSALTANTDTPTTRRCSEVGMNKVINKPINLDTLKRELTDLVQCSTGDSFE